MWILSKLSMSHRKRINAGDSPCIDVQYQNLYAQVASLLMPRKLRAVLGRGSAKTTDFQAERLAEIIFDMPGAPLVWVYGHEIELYTTRQTGKRDKRQ